MAIWFDGSDDNIGFGGTLNVPSQSDQFTMCAWAYREKSATMYIMSKSSGTSTGNNTWTIGIDSRNRFNGRLKIAGTTTDINSGTTYSEDTWYHVAMTYDGATMKLYVDGVEKNSASRTGYITTDSRLFAIGTRGNSSRSREWRGQIKDCRVYNKALTQTEIQTIIASQGSDFITDKMMHWWPLREGVDGTVPGDTSVYDIVGGAHSVDVSSSPLYRNDDIRISR